MDERDKYKKVKIEDILKQLNKIYMKENILEE